MSRQRKQYSDRVIEVTTYELKDNKGFTAHFAIEDHTAGGHIDITHFESPNPFTTEAEAFAWAFATARHKIDTGYEKGTIVENISS